MTATLDADARAAVTPRTTSTWRIAAWATSLLAVAAHLYVARSALVEGVPTFTYDEIDTLFAGRAALGITTPQITGAGYFPLSAILVAPLWWLTSDPYTFYRAATLVGVVVAVATIWPLSRVATRLGLTSAQAVTVAAVVMTLPARTVQADYQLAEKLLFLLVAVVALAAVRLAERPTYGRAVLFAGAVALAYFDHARMLVLVGVAAIWLVLFGLLPLLGRGTAGADGSPARDTTRWRVALAGLVPLLVLSWGAGRLGRHINALVNPNGFHQGKALSEHLRDATPGLVARAGLGQSWEQLISGFGLPVVGAVLVLVLAWRELRRREVGLMTLVLGAVLALFAGSVVAWSAQDQLFATTWRRLDVWIYGRYVDPVFELLTLVALAALVTGVRRAVAVSATVLALAISVPTVLWVAKDAPTWGFVTPAHIPGAMAWWWAMPDHRFAPGLVPSLTNENRFWLWATLTSLLPLALLLALVVLRRRVLVVGGLVLALAVGGTYFANRASDHYQANHGPDLPLIKDLRTILADHPGTTVAVVEQCPSRQVPRPGGRRNRLAWAMLPTIVGRDPKADIVVACPDAEQVRSMAGALRLSEPIFGVLYAYVRPGPLQDDLRSRGLLSAAG